MEPYFSVPDIPGGRSDQPLDLGTMFLSPAKRLRMAKPAPDFAARGLDGKDVKLSDFRGKLLVLYFFGRRPIARPAAGRPVEAAPREEGQRGRDPRRQLRRQPRGHQAVRPEQRPLKWPHATSRFGWGLIDTLKGTGIPPQYNPYPSRVFLIDEKGNIIGMNIQPDQIEATVYRTLFER